MELGRQIASALAAAHDAGILHRDLKAENVLVNGEGRAKLVDFGIAKRLTSLPEESSPTLALEDFSADGLPLTGPNQLLGTVRAMSPEQALGESLDRRSDLFSLGILLYEMATGSSPFVAESAIETLRRICDQPHEPARDRNPALSRRFSSCIDRLLEKKPQDRLQRAEEAALERCAAAPAHHRQWAKGGVAVLLLVALGALGWWSRREPPPPRYVVVSEPSIRSRADDGAELLAAGVYSVAQQALSQLVGIAALPAEEAEIETGSAAELARVLGAAETLTLRLECPLPRCDLALARVAAKDGRILWLDHVELPPDDLPLLETAVVGRLREAYADFPPRADARAAVPHAAYAELLRLGRSFQDRRGPDQEALVEALGELRRRHPEFLEAFLVEAEVARELFVSSREQRWFDHASGLGGWAPCWGKGITETPKGRAQPSHRGALPSEGGPSTSLSPDRRDGLIQKFRSLEKIRAYFKLIRFGWSAWPERSE